MTDDLVGRLRSYADTCVGLEPRRIITKAADHIAGTGKLVARIEALEVEKADMAWFSTQRRLSLDFYSPMYGDDDDQSEEWRVTQESGSINDREWDVIGRGDTVFAAVAAARAALTPEAPHMQTDAEVAAIAAGLTKAQQECLLAIRPGEERRAIDFRGAVAMRLCAATGERPALLHVTQTNWGSVSWYRHTADGLRVAQHLKQENAK